MDYFLSERVVPLNFWCRRLRWGHRSVCRASWPWISRLPPGPCGSWGTCSSGSTTPCSTGPPTGWASPRPSSPPRSAFPRLGSCGICFFRGCNEQKLHLVTNVVWFHLQPIRSSRVTLQELALHVHISHLLRGFLVSTQRLHWTKASFQAAFRFDMAGFTPTAALWRIIAVFILFVI